MPKLVVDLYAGARGWDEGARMVGVGPVVGIELDEWACRTSAAAGHPVVRADVETYPTGHLAGQVDGLIASPPCQAFSTAGRGAGRIVEAEIRRAVVDAIRGRRNLAAHRREMVRVLRRAYLRTLPKATKAERSALACAQVRGATQVVVCARWVHDVRPRWVACEQVPAVLPLWQAMRPGLERLGYSVAVGLLSSERFGVPQTRRRAILVARRDGRPARLPAPTHRAYDARAAVPDDGVLFDDGLRPWVSMAAALGWSGAPTVTPSGDRRTPGGNEFDAARPSWGLTEKTRSWVVRTHERAGGNEFQASAEFDPDARPSRVVTHDARDWIVRTGNNSRTTAGPYDDWRDTHASYERSVDAPAPTLDTRVSGKWTVSRPATMIAGDPRVFQPGGHHEPGEQSANAIRVSVTDALVLQSFRPDYPMRGPRSRQFLQVGNAVPPLLAAAVLGELHDVPWRDLLWPERCEAAT